MNFSAAGLIINRKFYISPVFHANMNNNLENRLNMGIDMHPLKLGSSFSNAPSRETFHTIKCKFVDKNIMRHKGHFMIHRLYFFTCLFFLDDFKPASVDTSKTGKLDVSSNSQVTVTVPHLGKIIVLLG